MRRLRGRYSISIRSWRESRRMLMILMRRMLMMRMKKTTKKKSPKTTSPKKKATTAKATSTTPSASRASSQARSGSPSSSCWSVSRPMPRRRRLIGKWKRSGRTSQISRGVGLGLSRRLGRWGKTGAIIPFTCRRWAMLTRLS